MSQKGEPSQRETWTRMVAVMVQSLTKTSVVMHLGWHNQTAQYRLGSVWLQRSLAEGGLEDKYASCELLQQQRRIGSRVVSTGAFLAEVETTASHCTQHLSGCTWTAVPSYGPQNSRKALTGEGPKEAHEDDERVGAPALWDKSEEISGFFPWRREEKA